MDILGLIVCVALPVFVLSIQPNSPQCRPPMLLRNTNRNHCSLIPTCTLLAWSSVSEREESESVWEKRGDGKKEKRKEGGKFSPIAEGQFLPSLLRQVTEGRKGSHLCGVWTASGLGAQEAYGVPNCLLILHSSLLSGGDAVSLLYFR